MNKEKELIKNTIIILLGKVCTQFISFFLLPLYTNFLNSNQYGTVDLITTYVALFVPVITLQLEMAIFRELIDFRNNDIQKKKIITTGITSAIIHLLLVLIIIALIGFFIKINYLLYIMLNITVVLISNLLLQISRGNGDNVGYSVACVISGIGTILFNLLFIIILKFKVEGMLLSTILANILSIIYLIFRIKIAKYYNLSFLDKERYKKLLKYSLPLVPNGLIWWIINASDRTLITLILGAGANGIYAVSNKFSTILVQFYNVFNLSWTESASLHINAEDKDVFFSKVFNNTIKIFYSICILFISFLPFVFNFLVAKEFSDAYNYIPILILGMMFNIVVSFIGCIYVAKKLTKEVAITSLCSGLLNIIINVILIKKIKIYAAALSTLIAFLIMTIYRIYDVKKYVILKINYKMLVALSILFIFDCISYYSFNWPLKILSFAVCTVIICIYNKNIAILIKNKLKNKSIKDDFFKFNNKKNK